MSGKPAWQQDYYNGNDLITVPGAVAQSVFAMQPVAVDFTCVPVEKGTAKANVDAKLIHSVSSQLDWNYGKKHIVVKSNRTQGIIGKPFGPVALPAVKADIATAFVSLLFTPLDDQPLATSRSILITALARDKQTGGKYSDDGTKLLAVGTAPLLLEPVQASITLKGAPPFRSVRWIPTACRKRKL
jgi:hypothetical protein